MATTQLPDALLVKNYIAGDENALVILIKRHQSKIYGFIYSKIKNYFKILSNFISLSYKFFTKSKLFFHLSNV